MKQLIIYHYPREDEECNGDYYDVEVVIDLGVVAKFGDYYHEKGAERAQSFINGYRFAIGLPQINHHEIPSKSIADRD